MREENATSARPLPLRRRATRSTLAALALVAVAIGACGEEAQRQDADEPEAKFPVEVVSAKFPTEQRLAKRTDLTLEIANAGDEEIPDLAITINTGDQSTRGSFNTPSDQPGLADSGRAVWILDHGFPKVAEPGDSDKDLDAAPSAGSAAAQTNTFSFGALPEGESKEIVWRVTPVQAGTFTVRYELAAGLGGNAKAVTTDGSPVEGEFVITIDDKPPRSRVNDAGEVVTQG